MRISITDTIAAISTPVGVGGIGIVRLSGPSALEVAGRVFHAVSGRRLSEFATHTVHFGRIKSEEGEVLDEVLLTVMRAPHSYTGEDIVEISGHGGPVALKVILDLVIRQGARLADPGEFTRRAFLSGRLDLVQAEAVLDIIEAKTESSLRVSTQHLEGDLSRELAVLREEAMKLYTDLEAVVNFPEEDIEKFDAGRFVNPLQRIQARVADLLATSEEGRIIKEGIRVVLCGRPNVGKSSLLNVLLRQPRAIVSSIAGTTRDTIEETAQVRGIPLQLVDTAGFLIPRDEIEEEAVRRSRSFIQNADLVLFLLDASQPLSREDEQIRDVVALRPTLIVCNKGDLPKRIDEKDIQKLMPGVNSVVISALKRAGIDELEAAILKEVLRGRPMDTHRIMITSRRHVASLRECQEDLRSAQECLQQKMSPEFISEEIRCAIQALDRITGRDADQDLLDQIFNRFCIGK